MCFYFWCNYIPNIPKLILIHPEFSIKSGTQKSNMVIFSIRKIKAPHFSIRQSRQWVSWWFAVSPGLTPMGEVCWMLDERGRKFGKIPSQHFMWSSFVLKLLDGKSSVWIIYVWKLMKNCRVFVEVPEFPLASHSQKSCNDKQVRCLRCHCIFINCQTPFTRIHNLVPLTSENQNKKTVLPTPSAFSRFQRLQNGSPMWPNNFPCEPCSHGSCGRSVCSWLGHEDFDIQSRIRQHRSNRSDRCRWSWRESRHPTHMLWITKWRSENKGSVLNLWSKSNKKMKCLVSKFSWSPLSRPRLLSIL